jgi:hypothetical protein
MTGRCTGSLPLKLPASGDGEAGSTKWCHCDRDGQLVWIRIRRAIAELQAAPTGLLH